MPVTGEIVIPPVEHLVKHVVHRLHQVVPSSMVGGQINVPFRATQQAFAGDGGLACLIFIGKLNKRMGC